MVFFLYTQKQVSRAKFWLLAVAVAMILAVTVFGLVIALAPPKPVGGGAVYVMRISGDESGA